MKPATRDVLSVAWWIATNTPAGLMALGMFTGAVLTPVLIYFIA